MVLVYGFLESLFINLKEATIKKASLLKSREAFLFKLFTLKRRGFYFIAFCAAESATPVLISAPMSLIMASNAEIHKKMFSAREL